MNKYTIGFKIPRQSNRANHDQSFDDNPDKSKYVKPKNSYKRKPKYVNKIDNWQ
jgi:hypothetical protein